MALRFLFSLLAAALLLCCTQFEFDNPNDPDNWKVYRDKGNDISNYRTVPIGTQVWMAENLNYNVPGSKCYGEGFPTEVQANCDKYGRLYDWATAMALPSTCNLSSCASSVSAKHQGICPSGWHIPSSDDWEALSSYVQSDMGCSRCDARHLKAASGWDDGNGWDSYGFAALPGGSGGPDGGFGNAGY